MKILALEFSSAQRSVAVVQSICDSAMHPVLSEVIETGTRAVNAIGMIAAALREAQVEREQITCLAVGLGPGSYTGIRLAIAVAQGWELGAGSSVKLLGIGSAESIAEQVRDEQITGRVNWVSDGGRRGQSSLFSPIQTRKKCSTDPDAPPSLTGYGRVNVVIDAQRGEFYLGVYDLTPQSCRQLEPLRLATQEELLHHEQANECFVGPDVAVHFRGGRLIFPRAASIGRLALGRSDFVSGEKLEPIYLRETKFVKAPPPRIIQ